MILNRNNSSQISISTETSAPQQAGGSIRKSYFGISNFAACRQKRFSIGSLVNNRFSIMYHCAKICVSYWFFQKKYGSDKQTIQLVFPPPVTMIKSQEKKCQNYFRVITITTVWLSRRDVNFEETDTERSTEKSELF